MPETKSIYSQAQTAIDLLERLSADSKWAHQGSGYRGALLRELNLIHAMDGEAEHHASIQDAINRLQGPVDASFDLLEKAAIDLID
jgi:hypothetical protein